MKYLTKEWYNKMQCTKLHSGLTIDKRSDVFSEVFYQKLSRKAREDFLKTHSILVNYEEYKKIVQGIEFMDLKEDDLRSNFELLQESLKGMTLVEYFDYCQNLKIKTIKEKIPKSILHKIKDIRVFSLGYVSKNVYNLLKKYCDDNNKFVEEKFDEYTKLEEETFKNDSLEFIEWSFHDAYISCVRKNKRDIEILMDNVGSFTDKKGIIFKNCNIFLDENIEGTYWLYNEIYKIKNGYEVHILTSYDDLREFIVECEDIILS